MRASSPPKRPYGRQLLSLTVCAMALPICFPMPAAGQVILRWGLQAREPVRYALTQREELTITSGGKTLGSKNEQRVELAVTLRDKDAEGNLQLNVLVERVQINAGEYKLDSKAEPNPDDENAVETARLLKAVMAAPMRVKPPPGLAEVLGEQEESVLSVMFSPAGMRRLLAELGVGLPADPVQDGDRWSRKLTYPVPGLGNQTLDFVYAYRGPVSEPGQQLEQIEGQVKVSVEPAEGSKVKLEIKSQQGQVRLLFDNQSGRLHRSRLEQQAEMRITVGDDANIDQSLKAVTLVELLEGK